MRRTLSKSLLLLLAVLLLGMSLAGCGQKGPLYLPEKDEQPENPSN